MLTVEMNLKQCIPVVNFSGALLASMEGYFEMKLSTMGRVVISLVVPEEQRQSSIYRVVNFKNINLQTRLSIYCWYNDNNIYWQWKANFFGDLKNISGIQIDQISFQSR